LRKQTDLTNFNNFAWKSLSARRATGRKSIREAVTTHLDSMIVTEVATTEIALILAATGSITTRAIMIRRKEPGGSIIESMTMRGIIGTAKGRGIITKGITKTIIWRGQMKMVSKARPSDIRSIIIIITITADPMKVRSGLKAKGLRKNGTHLMTQSQSTHLILRQVKLKRLALFRKSRRRTLI
jgi:hypothetical protein